MSDWGLSIFGGGSPVVQMVCSVLLVGGLCCAARFIPSSLVSGARRRRLEGLGIAGVDSLDPKELELFLEIRFRARGYSVLRSENHGDWCSDLIVEKDGVQTVVQSKRYEQDVTIRGIKEVEAARIKYRCSNAIVVTNRNFTNDATALANSGSIELWDRSRLVAELMGIKPRDIWETAIRPGGSPFSGDAQKAIPVGS